MARQEIESVCVSINDNELGQMGVSWQLVLLLLNYLLNSIALQKCVERLLTLLHQEGTAQP